MYEFRRQFFFREHAKLGIKDRALIAETVYAVLRHRRAIEAIATDGVPRKMVDTTFAASLGWRARTPLRDGLAATYRWYVDHIVPERSRAVA